MTMVKIAVQVGALVVTAGISFYAGKKYSERKTDYTAREYLRVVMERMEEEYAALVEKMEKAEEHIRRRLYERMEALNKKMLGPRSNLKTVVGLRAEIEDIIKDMMN